MGHLLPFPQVTSGSIQRYGYAVRYRQTDPQTQTRVTNIHFASSMTHAKCNKLTWISPHKYLSSHFQLNWGWPDVTKDLQAHLCRMVKQCFIGLRALPNAQSTVSKHRCKTARNTVEISAQTQKTSSALVEEWQLESSSTNDVTSTPLVEMHSVSDRLWSTWPSTRGRWQPAASFHFTRPNSSWSSFNSNSRNSCESFNAFKQTSALTMCAPVDKLVSSGEGPMKKCATNHRDE